MTDNNPHPQPHAQPDSDEIDLGYLLAICIDHKWWIGGITLAITVMGILYSLLATPEYRADALLQIESEERNLGDLEAVMLGQEPAQSNTQSEILRSRMIMRRAGIQAGLDIVLRPATLPIIGNVLQRRQVERPGIARGWASVWAGESISVETLNVDEELLNEELTLRIESSGAYSLLDEAGELLGTGEAGLLLTGNQPYFELLLSEVTAPPGAEFTLIKRSEPAMIRNLLNRFNVSERGRDTGILEVSLTGTDPQEITRSLDAITSVFLVQNINRQAAEAENRLAFLEEQSPEVRGTLSSAENALNDYRASRDSVDLSFETQSMLSQLVEIEARLNELQLEEEEIAQRFTRSHPSYQTLLEQRAQLESEKQRLEASAGNLPETQREVLRLNRDVEVTQEIYTQMLNTMQELRIARAGTVGSVRILDEALVGNEPIAPRRRLIAMISLFAGLLLGLATVLVRHAFRRGVESVDQIQASGLQVYATVPNSEKQQKLNQNTFKRSVKKGLREDINRITNSALNRIGFNKRQPEREERVKKKKIEGGGGLLAFKDPGDLAIEALRSLRTSLHFAMLEADNNVLMLTGPGPGVGKSFVSANLAAVCAQSGQRVLLIDGDMRKGHLHQLFDSGSENGLSDLLVGRVKLEAAVRQSEDANLDYIVRGTAPPNPSELLMSEAFDRFLDTMSRHYDLVIVDTPPVLAVTDAAIVGKLAGTTLLVARFQGTQFKEIERADEQLHAAGVKVRGAILNAVEKSATSYYGYGYGYYHYEYKPGA